MPASLTFWDGLWLGIVNNMGRTMAGALGPPILGAGVVWWMAMDLMGRSGGSGSRIRWIWSGLACFGIWLMDSAGFMVQGALSGFWILNYALIVFVTCVPLLIQRSQPSQPQPWNRFGPLAMIITCAVTCTQVVTSEDDAFAHHVTNCFIGMSGEAWLEEFADLQVKVYESEIPRSLGSKITVDSWEGKLSMSPRPGMGGSYFDFEDGVLQAVFINID